MTFLIAVLHGKHVTLYDKAASKYTLKSFGKKYKVF